MSEKAEAAHLIAKLLANRHTSLDEIPGLIESVQRALATLGTTAKEISIVSAPALKERRTRGKRAVTPPTSAPIPTSPEPAPKALPSMLVRRSAVISVAPTTQATAFAPAPSSALR